MALYPPPVLHLVLLGGPNDLFKALRMKYSVAFSAFQRKFGYERSEGCGGQYNGVTIREILSTDKVLEYLRTWPGVPDNVREAVVDYLKATWKVYLVSMKKEVDGDYEQVFRTFREKFELVRKLLRVSHTVKTHCVLDNMICHAPFQSLSWTTEL